MTALLLISLLAGPATFEYRWPRPWEQFRSFPGWNDFPSLPTYGFAFGKGWMHGRCAVHPRMKGRQVCIWDVAKI